MSSDMDGVPNELSRQPNSTVADRECPACEGTVWDLGDEQVCGSCSVVLGESSTSRTSIWDHFFDDRSEHNNSEQVRCIGGFPWVYAWVESDDIDGAVVDIDATKFYR